MFAVINLGLKSIRLCLLDAHAHILFKRSYPLHSVIFDEAVEQDGEEWWRLIGRLLADATAAGLVVSRIEAITVSASASCLACVAADGALLRPIIMVSDRRHHAVSSATAPVMLHRIQWLAECEPDNYRDAAYFLSPNDFLIHRLTGVPATDPLNAAKFGYSEPQGRYVGALTADLPRLPIVLPVGAAAGRLLPEVAREFHLNASTEVHLSSYDAMVSVVGSGAVDEGDMCDVSGTVTSIRMVAFHGRAHPTGAVTTQSMPLLDSHYIGGSTNMGGGLIEWLKTTFYDPQGHVYEHIDAEVLSIQPEQSALIFLPYLLGERAPLWDPRARGVFFGLERTHGRKHFARAAVEGAAFLGRSLIDEIMAVHGGPPKKIRLSGGLSRLGTANRIKADVYGLPVEVVAEFESTVIGAYLLAFHQRLAGDQPVHELCRRSVRVRDIILPDPEAAVIYRKKYEIFTDIYKALKPHFGKLRSIQTTALKSEDGMLENL